jgi:S1-C subfamily serine protease
VEKQKVTVTFKFATFKFAGDFITTINGEALDTTEAFRKILRKHYAWEEPMTFRVLRDGKSLEIQIPRPK